MAAEILIKLGVQEFLTTPKSDEIVLQFDAMGYVPLFLGATFHFNSTKIHHIVREDCVRKFYSTLGQALYFS